LERVEENYFMWYEEEHEGEREEGGHWDEEYRSRFYGGISCHRACGGEREWGILRGERTDISVAFLREGMR
jgi:hypothetical protein